MIERENSMCDIINTTQNAQIGSHDNSFVAQQINNYGVPVEQMPGMIIEATFKLFHQYFPQLQKEALEEVHQMLEEKIRAIPPENIVPPAARIAIPALQNASITEEHDIRELYANLLASSMNKVVKDGVHPAYVEIIKQLSPDEAKILYYLKNNPIVPIINLRAENKEHGGVTVVSNFTNIGSRIGCENPNRMDEYLDNIERLGLVKNMGELASLTDKTLYKPLEEDPYILWQMNEIKENTELYVPKIKQGYVELTNFGKAFCQLCCVIDDAITVVIK